MKWRPDEITFDIDTSATDRDVWTFTVLTPGCRLEVMTNPIATSPDGRRATLSGVHIQGAGPNEIGLTNLRVIAQRFCEEIGCDELVVEGAARTTGANPGRTPGRLGFKRSRRPRSA